MTTRAHSPQPDNGCDFAIVQNNEVPKPPPPSHFAPETLAAGTFRPYKHSALQNGSYVSHKEAESGFRLNVDGVQRSVAMKIDVALARLGNRPMRSIASSAEQARTALIGSGSQYCLGRVFTGNLTTEDGLGLYVFSPRGSGWPWSLVCRISDLGLAGPLALEIVEPKMELPLPGEVLQLELYSCPRAGQRTTHGMLLDERKPVIIECTTIPAVVIRDMNLLARIVPPRQEETEVA